MRKPIIAGNWKMHKTICETETLVKELIGCAQSEDVEVIIAPTALCLSTAKTALNDSTIHLGAQNMHHEDQGAFTGEVSPAALKELGVEYVILGHSERRQYFQETNAEVNLKVLSALKKGLHPILCVGETLEEREAGEANAVVLEELKEGLKEVSADCGNALVIAYEPIWAIGTGKTATKEDAQNMCAFIRHEVGTLLGNEFAQAVRILYGGSVKSSNIGELMEMSDIDGALVGGASLKADEFAKIVHFK